MHCRGGPHNLLAPRTLEQPLGEELDRGLLKAALSEEPRFAFSDRVAL